MTGQRPLTPRHRRLLTGLMAGPLSREQADRITGCSNTPDEVFRLRRRGLDLPCTFHKGRDRDGRAVEYGVYTLSDADRERATALLAVPAREVAHVD